MAQQKNKLQVEAPTAEPTGPYPSGPSSQQECYGSVIGAIALGWSIFQLSLASWLILDSLAVRAIHLGFALLIVFVAYPFRKQRTGGMFQERLDLRLFFRAVVACLACVAAIYILLDYHGISSRQGAPLERDVFFGTILLVLLLEAGRRAIGPALPAISIFFLVYALYGSHLPDFLAFKGVSLSRLLGQMTMSTEGIYGIPLDVSANIVFLFVLFGAMLEKAGAGNYFIAVALSLLGRFRGGPAKAAVLGSGLTGMISGSSIANVVTTGTFTIPLMKKAGYPATKAAAIEVAAGIDGQLMPPVMGAAAFIIAEYVNVPYVEVAKSALIPAIVSYSALFYITHVEACKMGIMGMDRDEIPRFRQVFFSGLHYLIPLAVLIVELIYFRHSPQMAVFRAILVLALIIGLQHPIEALLHGLPLLTGIKKSAAVLIDSLIGGARNMVGVAIATACAGIIVGVVTLGLGGLVTEVIERLSGGNLYVMLLITAIASLIIGMGLPTTATYIVVASLTAPAMVLLGEVNGFIIPLMAAHLFCFYFGILADDTPPVGLASFAAAAIAGSDPVATGLQGFMYHIRTAILPFIFVFNHDLLLIGVNTIAHGVLILFSSVLGILAFVSATQGWFVTSNRWYEVPCLLAVTLAMMRPDLPASWFGLPNKYITFFPGVALWLAIYFLQRHRATSV
ncbi:MAG: TRAP transporter permease [Deltaproteobacteria bacterium]|jgi:TRAP transporter 4TM/12TM fusion protein|nr:TRAP transporter permease [Deltaproteobacteria bacterium]